MQPSQIEIWFQDEARIGQQGTLTRLWAAKGTRPRVVRQQQFINSYIFGAVCPTHDKGAALILPIANIASMKKHLEEISDCVDAGNHAVVVLDQARWHVSKGLKIQDNLSLLSLPPYSPELNPQENVWLFLRQHYLANRCSEDREDIISACCNAWNQFISQSGRIKNLCSRQWTSLSA